LRFVGCLWLFFLCGYICRCGSGLCRFPALLEEVEGGCYYESDDRYASDHDASDGAARDV